MAKKSKGRARSGKEMAKKKKKTKRKSKNKKVSRKVVEKEKSEGNQVISNKGFREGLVSESLKVKDGNSPANRKLQTEKDIAMDFATKVQKKFDRIVKASVLFGSQVKDNATEGSDIDIILIVDDSSINWDLELVAWYREELGKLVASQRYARALHINTVKLTTWWLDMLHGDPVVINILRYGEALIDYGGFFNPLKALLLQGKMKSTPEAVMAALRRAPAHIARSKASEVGAVEGVYWAMVDASQAALITAGKMPPSPEHIPKMLKEVFVDSGMLKMSYVKGYQELYDLHKNIAHGQISDINGEEIDEWQNMAEKYLAEISKIIDQMLKGEER
jgi:uncharacterized protein (UPF0332 family)/predicted nucleotidyltransferase